MATDLTIAARLSLDSRRWVEGTNRGLAATRGFVSGVRREVGELRGFLGSAAGRFAQLGAGFTVASQLVRSAKMDKSLTQLGQTAGASTEQVKALRGELFDMARQTGRSVDDLQSGVNVLVASGQKWDEARQTIRAVNTAMVVTGASAETLAGSLSVASTAFQFDLAKPDMAVGLLDRMTVAGRLGNAELESLGATFGRIGVNASRAGLGFDQTLAFIEGLSLIERNPERLATLADSTLRLFTNAKYLKDAQKATGVKFFDEKGGRRDPFVVLADLKKRLDKFKTDAQRENFLSKAFGQADLDTIKGLSTLLTGDMLTKVKTFEEKIGGAGGTLARDLPAAVSNAVDQTGRLRAALTKTADDFAQRINAPLSRITAKLLDSKQSGGLGLSGGQLIGGGAAGLLALYLGKRLAGAAGKRLLGGLLGGSASLGTGVAMGTALERAGAATPVFVVGAAPGLFSAGAGAGAGGASGVVASGGRAAGALKWAGGVGLAAAGGWAIGTGIDKATDAVGPLRRMKELHWGTIFRGLEMWKALLTGDRKEFKRLGEEGRVEVKVLLADGLRAAGVSTNNPAVKATVRSTAKRPAPTGRMMYVPRSHQ